jgi:hypothetical protein
MAPRTVYYDVSATALQCTDIRGIPERLLHQRLREEPCSVGTY